MIKLVVIADDLTGALDTGVQFTKKNLSTIVTSNLNFNESYKDYDVVVVNTESRHLSNNEAKKNVEKALLEFSNKNVKFFYKKIDSTLRGNLGSELEGFIEGLSIQKLSLIPAFPLGSRIVKNGILYVNKIPLCETQFSKDILNPIKNSYIPEILKTQTSIKTSLKNVDNFVFELSEQEKEIYIFDALDTDDLVNIGKSLYKRSLLKYTAGSAGFAQVLADYIKGESKETPILLEDDRILFVCGSVNDVSLKQCKYAEILGYKTEVLKFQDIVGDNYKNSQSYILHNDDFRKKINNFKNILIKTSDSKEVISESIDYAKRNNISIKNITHNISNNTGELIADLLLEYDLKNIIVFGGDTLAGILKKISCDSIIPLKEIIPGVVFTKALVGDKSINIITKAGGFGDEDVIEKIHNFFKNMSSDK
ncbi:four-carbon acid sugar kinase family protein [Cetobacterium sp.]|uniref:four-carbon acid sugar kinase family protein n=1 Tax=Cetobacterium sp. TaxID=2071632 RepID=UPI003F2D38FA